MLVNVIGQNTKVCKLLIFGDKCAKITQYATLRVALEEENLKKLIIGMLLLIPIIVILVVSLTATLVTGAYIAVEDVKIYIKTADGKETPAPETMITYLSDKGMQLIAMVYPKAAQNKEVVWSVVYNAPTVEVEGDEELEVVTVDKNGYVSFKNLGEATVQVATLEGNIKATIELFVTSSDVMGLSLEKDDGLKNIAVGDRVKVTAKINPSDAKIEQKYLKWEVVSGKDFADVDENGIVTAKKEGEVELKASFVNPPKDLEEENKFATVKFTIGARAADKAFVASEYTFVGGNEIEISSVLANKNTTLAVDRYTTTADATIADGKLKLNSALDAENERNVVLYAVDALGNTIDEIKVKFKQVNVKNTDLWQTEEISGKILLKIGSAGIHMPIETSRSGKAVISSSNDRVVTYDKTHDCIIAKASGEATISVTVDGVTDSFDVKVVPAIYSIGLYFNALNDEVGIEMKRYFGKRTYNIDNTVTDNLSFELRYVITTDGDKTILLKTADEIAKIDKYINFSIDDEARTNGYSISHSGVLTTVDKGNAVTVTAKSLYPIYESVDVKAEYKLNLISNGVNVGLPKKADREREDFNLNEFTINGFNKVNELAKEWYDAHGNDEDFVQKYSIVVQESMVFGGKTNNLYTSIYGNGEYLRQIEEDDPKLGTKKSSKMPDSLLKVVVDDVLIQNVTIRASRALKEKETMYDYSKAGNGILIDGRERYYPNGEAKQGRLKNIVVKYTTIENAYYCCFVAAADVSLEGTLMRNSGQQTLYINTSVQDVYDGDTLVEKMNVVATIKNTVFTNAINMSIGIITYDLDSSYDEMVYDDVTGKNIPKFELYFRKVSMSDIHFEGFCHIYNWKTASELDFSYLKEYFYSDPENVKQSEKKAYENMVGLLRAALSSNVDSLLDNMGWGDIRKKVNGTNYFQLAVGNLGVHYPVSGKVREGDLESVGLTGLCAMDLTKVAASFGGASFATKISYPLYFYCYSSASPEIGPTDVCVPNVALYKKLVNGIGDKQ